MMSQSIISVTSANDVTFSPGFRICFGVVWKLQEPQHPNRKQYYQLKSLNATNPITIINSNPIINTVYIAPIDTTALINATGITVIGVSSPAIDNVTILSYKTVFRLSGVRKSTNGTDYSPNNTQNSSVSQRQEENNISRV